MANQPKPNSEKSDRAAQPDVLNQQTSSNKTLAGSNSVKEASEIPPDGTSPTAERAPRAPHPQRTTPAEGQNSSGRTEPTSASDESRMSNGTSPASNTRRILSRDDGSLEDAGTPVRGAVAFFVFAILGVGFIVFGKMHDFDPQKVVLAPLLLMGIYAVVLLGFKSLRLRDDQAGDNLYYLGFLYTLTSIGVSLYQFTGAASADQIVSNFGIAVSSTIAGLTLRIAINQMRTDPAEVERVARHELASASRRLRQELDTITSELGLLNRTTQQKTRDILDVQKELVAEIREFLTKTQALVNEDQQQIAKKMLDQLHSIDQSVRNGRETHRELLKEGATQIGAATSQAVSDSISKLAGSGNISEKLDSLGKDLAGIFRVIEEHSRVSYDMQDAIYRVLANGNGARTNRPRRSKKPGFFARMFGKRDV